MYQYGDVVSAPTGSGKTALFELALCRLLRQQEKGTAKQRVVYIAPMKALVEQKARDWGEPFAQLGLKPLLLTGDVSVRDTQEDLLADADVLLTTPEKFDAMARQQIGRQKGGLGYFSDIALVLIGT